MGTKPARASTERSSGQSLVEFALMLPFLVMLIVGSLDLGRAYFSYMSVVNAAREGARYGAFHPTDNTAIIARAKNEVDTAFMNPSSMTVSPQCASSCAYLDTIVVTVSYPFTLLTTQAVGGGTITLRAKAEMEISAGKP